MSFNSYAGSLSIIVFLSKFLFENKKLNRKLLFYAIRVKFSIRNIAFLKWIKQSVWAVIFGRITLIIFQKKIMENSVKNSRIFFESVISQQLLAWEIWSRIQIMPKIIQSRNWINIPLLHKPFVNEVALRLQKWPSRCCKPFDF